MKKLMIIPALLVSSLLLIGSADVWADQAASRSTATTQNSKAMTSHPEKGHTSTVVTHPAKPKPAAKKESKTEQPHELMVWIPGDYFWDGEDWVWADAYWIDQPWDEAIWIPGYWVDRSWGWVWIPGHWF